MQVLKLPAVITGFFGVMDIVSDIWNFHLNQSHKDPVNSRTNSPNKVNDLFISQLGFEVIKVVDQLFILGIFMPKKLKTSRF